MLSSPAILLRAVCVKHLLAGVHDFAEQVHGSVLLAREHKGRYRKGKRRTATSDIAGR